MGTGSGEAQGASRIIYPDIPYPDIPDPLTPADLHRLFISSYAERQWGLRHFLLPKVTVGFAGDSSTSRPSAQATAQRLLQINRGHWVIESSCHYIIDWNYDEDRSRIRSGYGLENISRLRRFAVGLIKSKPVRSVAQTMRQLNRNMRLIFD